MSFRERMLARNHMVTARFVPIFQYSELDGVSYCQPIEEKNPRLYEDMTIKKMLDSGLPLREFKRSPDGAELQNTISIDADLKVVADVLEERGYDINKTLISENSRMSRKSQSSQGNIQPSANPDTNINNTNNNNNNNNE